MTVKRKNKVLTLEILHQNHECSFARNLKFNMGLSNDAMIYMCVYVCVIYLHIYKFQLKALYSMKVLYLQITFQCISTLMMMLHMELFFYFLCQKSNLGLNVMQQYPENINPALITRKKKKVTLQKQNQSIGNRVNKYRVQGIRV